MDRSVAFLRGINVGGRRVTKDELIEVFVGLGCDRVDTFLASGNVLFEPRPEATSPTLEAALEAALGYPVPTTLRSGAEVRALAEAEPFDRDQLAASTGKPQAILLFAEPDPEARAEVEALASADDRLAFGPGVLHWLPAGGISESSLDLDRIGRLIGTLTVRTTNTLRRLVPKL